MESFALYKADVILSRVDEVEGVFLADQES